MAPTQPCTSRCLMSPGPAAVPLARRADAELLLVDGRGRGGRGAACGGEAQVGRRRAGRNARRHVDGRELRHFGEGERRAAGELPHGCACAKGVEG
eukprot:355701-Chlamydomonas_euryale.AAC.2